MALREFGMSPTRIDAAVEAALANPYWNPRPLEREPLRELLRAACDGTRPAL
jgi:maleylacetate reductase